MVAKVYVHKDRGHQVRYILYFPDGSQATRYRYLPTRSEAESVRRDCEFLERGSRSGSLSSREIIQARHDGLLSEADARMLSGGRVCAVYDLDKVLENYKSTIAVSHTASALAKTEGRLVWLTTWFRSAPIPSITEDDVNRYILDRRSGALSYKNPKSGFARVGVKPKTVRNEVWIMIGVVDEAVKLRMVESNIIRKITVPVKTSKLRRSLNRTEVLRLMTAALEHRNMMHGQLYEFVMVALFTGFRRSELRTLSWDDVNLETRRILVQSKEITSEADFTTKSGTARFKSIPDKLYPILAGMERKGRFLFGGEQPYQADVISQTVKKLFEKAGLPESLSLHHCRHTYGSWLLRITGDLKKVQEEMGHLDIETTKNYMHTIEDETDPARSFDYE